MIERSKICEGEMGKGAGEFKDGEVEEVNMAAWLVGPNKLKILPFKLPPLGNFSFFIHNYVIKM